MNAGAEGVSNNISGNAFESFDYTSDISRVAL